MLLRQNDKTDYNYKEYILDTVAELAQIDINQCCTGSMVYIIESKEIYILNSKKEWVLF